MACCYKPRTIMKMTWSEDSFDKSSIFDMLDTQTATLIEFVQQISKMLLEKAATADKLLINFEVKQDLFEFIHDRLNGEFGESFTEDLTVFCKKYNITLDNLHVKKFKLLRVIVFEKIKTN